MQDCRLYFYIELLNLIFWIVTQWGGKQSFEVILWLHLQVGDIYFRGICWNINNVFPYFFFLWIIDDEISFNLYTYLCPFEREIMLHYEQHDYESDLVFIVLKCTLFSPWRFMNILAGASFFCRRVHSNHLGCKYITGTFSADSVAQTCLFPYSFLIAAHWSLFWLPVSSSCHVRIINGMKSD